MNLASIWPIRIESPGLMGTLTSGSRDFPLTEVPLAERASEMAHCVTSVWGQNSACSLEIERSVTTTSQLAVRPPEMRAGKGRLGPLTSGTEREEAGGI